VKTPGKVMGATVASLAVLIAVTGIILYFGFIPLPDFPSLATAPDPAIPGTIAYHSWTEEEGACIGTVPASGGPVHQVVCQRDSDAVAWTGEGNLVVEDYSGPRPILVVLDAATGAVLDRVESAEGGLFELVGDKTVRSDGSRIQTESDSEGSAQVLVVATNGAPTTVVDVEGAPRDYYFLDWGLQWSPDGAWIAAWDSAGRLLVAEASGTSGARALVETEEGYGQFAWYIPGNPTYTVDVSQG